MSTPEKDRKMEEAVAEIEKEAKAEAAEKKAAAKEKKPDINDLMAEINAMKAELDKAKEALKPEEEAKPAEAEDPWQKMVKIRSPRDPNIGDSGYFVAVNDRRWQIPADGKEWEVPEPIAIAFQGMLDADARADEVARAIEAESADPVLKPKARQI